MQKALLVCSNDRIDSLAGLLNSAGISVFGVKGKSWLLWTDENEFETCTEREVRDQTRFHFDFLFFHTGSGDYNRIPSSVKATVEFSFSGGNHPRDIESRPNAVKILRQFTIGVCPFTPEIVKEFVAYLDNNCSPEYLPSICRLTNVMEYLPALSILCQGYLAVVAIEMGLGNGSNQIVEDALKQMGWNDEVAALCQYEESNFTDDENNIKKSISWQDVFQTKSVTGVKKEVAMELGIDDLDGSETYMDIAGLINEIEAGHEIEVETVAKAYLCLTHKLEQF